MIKNSNDLLGLIIKMANSNGDVDTNELVEAAGIDRFSVDTLSKELADKHYIIYTLDTFTLTDLGRIAYKPWYKRIAEPIVNVILRLIGIFVCIAIAVAIARG